MLDGVELGEAYDHDDGAWLSVVASPAAEPCEYPLLHAMQALSQLSYSPELVSARPSLHRPHGCPRASLSRMRKPVTSSRRRMRKRARSAHDRRRDPLDACSARRFASAAIPWVVGTFMVLAIGDEVEGSLAPLGTLVGVVQGAALHWRRSRPVLVLAVTLAGALATQALAPDVILPIPGYFAIFALAAERPPRSRCPDWPRSIAVTSGNFLVVSVGDSVFAIALTVGAWALGEAARSRHAAIDEAARRAASEEQARIAREMHDVIAHSVSAIVVQAAAADDVFDEHPDQARAALRSIDAAGRDALDELRRLLSAVRPGAEGDPRTTRLRRARRPASTASTSSPSRCARRACGSPCTARASPARCRPASSCRRTASSRRRSPTRCATRAPRAPRSASSTRRTRCEVDVRDDGRNGSPVGAVPGGHGIAGMSERAALLGGTLEVGPLPRGAGYRVLARLPLGASR